MSIELIAIIVVLIVNLIGFFFLNLKIHHVFYDLDTKIDRMDAKMDRLAQESRNRDDNLALRIDELYRGLLKKAA